MNALFTAIRVWWRTQTWGVRLRGLGVVGGVGVLLVCAGGAASLCVRPRVVTVHDSQTETRLTQQLNEATALAETNARALDVEKKRLPKVIKTTITHTEYDPACHGEPTSITTTETISKDEGSETHVQEQAGTKIDLKAAAQTVAAAQVAETVHDQSTPVPEPRWRTAILAGLSRTGAVVGAEAGYRLIGPLELGAWVTIPLGSPTAAAAGLSAGLRY